MSFEFLKQIFIFTFRDISQRKLNNKIKGFNKLDVLNEENFSKHFADEDLTEVGYQNVVKGFIIDRIRFIEEALGEDEIKKSSFIDLGDSSGIFIKSLGKKRLSVNISREAIKNIKEKGLEGIMADIENMPVRENQFDYVLFFETLEHVPNPIAVLKEINRFCRKSVFISIPYVSKTNIYRYNYDTSRPSYQNHIFEFDSNDFKNIISHSNFEIKSMKIVSVFDCGINLKNHIILLWSLFKEKDLFRGSFKKFAIYQLEKK